MNAMNDKNACELLDADHIAVKHLFVEYARLAATAATKDAARTRMALATQIGRELMVHMQIEEEIFYPALRACAPGAETLLDEAQGEHGQARELVARIGSPGSADAQLDELVAQLARAVEHHVKEERDELFPKAKTAAGLDLSELGEQLRERQQQLLGAPQPVEGAGRTRRPHRAS